MQGFGNTNFKDKPETSLASLASKAQAYVPDSVKEAAKSAVAKLPDSAQSVVNNLTGGGGGGGGYGPSHGYQQRNDPGFYQSPAPQMPGFERSGMGGGMNAGTGCLIMGEKSGF